MKKVNFLVKLKDKGKIELVEPSEGMKESYMRKSASNLESAKILLENGKLEESVSLAYYSMYHMVTALLFKTGIKSENHSASILFLKKIFGVDNSEILSAKLERVDKQYYVDFVITKEEVNGLIGKAEMFNGKMFDFISRQTNENIGFCREKFKKLVCL